MLPGMLPGFVDSGRPGSVQLNDRVMPGTGRRLHRVALMTYSTCQSSYVLVSQTLLLDDRTVIVGYEALRRYPPCSTGNQKASDEVVSKVVLCLRLFTWLVLVEHRRNPLTGVIMASRYAARSEPISFERALPGG